MFIWKTNARYTRHCPKLLVTADGLCAPSQKMNSSCLAVTVNQYLAVVASEWKQKNDQFIGALVLLTLTCWNSSTSAMQRGLQLSSGKESDKDCLLLERSLFQMYIKMPAFDDVKHLTGLVSCREREVSQEGAEAAVPSIVTMWLCGQHSAVVLADWAASRCVALPL